MARRSSTFHTSLHRPKMVMGTDPKAFFVVAFVAATLFAAQSYLALAAVLPLFSVCRLMTKRDPQFMEIFLRYLNEENAYTNLPKPSHWDSRPAGWGRGLPW